MSGRGTRSGVEASVAGRELAVRAEGAHHNGIEKNLVLTGGEIGDHVGVRRARRGVHHKRIGAPRAGQGVLPRAADQCFVAGAAGD